MLLGALYGVFHHSTDARALLLQSMPEGIALAEKLAIDLSEEDIEDLLTVLATLPPAGKTSMLQSRGERKTEVEIFAGRLVSMGEQTASQTR